MVTRGGRVQGYTWRVPPMTGEGEGADLCVGLVDVHCEKEKLIQKDVIVKRLPFTHEQDNMKCFPVLQLRHFNMRG